MTNYINPIPNTQHVIDYGQHKWYPNTYPTTSPVTWPTTYTYIQTTDTITAQKVRELEKQVASMAKLLEKIAKKLDVQTRKHSCPECECE